MRNDVELMLGLRKGVSYGNAPAHHGVDLNFRNPARAAREAAAEDHSADWTPPVLGAVAIKGEGIGRIVAALDRRHWLLEQSGDCHAGGAVRECASVSWMWSSRS